MNHQDFSNYLISGSKSDLDKAFFHFDKTMRIPFQYWSYFHYWLKSIDDSDIAEVYQESLIVFYNRISNTGTEGINTSLKSFFYGIARNKWREYFRKRKFTEELSDVFGVTKLRINKSKKCFSMLWRFILNNCPNPVKTF